MRRVAEFKFCKNVTNLEMLGIVKWKLCRKIKNWMYWYLEQNALVNFMKKQTDMLNFELDWDTKIILFFLFCVVRV